MNLITVKSILFSSKSCSPSIHLRLCVFCEQRNWFSESCWALRQSKQIRIEITLIKNILVQVFGQSWISFVLLATQQEVNLCTCWWHVWLENQWNESDKVADCSNHSFGSKFRKKFYLPDSTFCFYQNLESWRYLLPKWEISMAIFKPSLI